jgi:hypothetical protein
MNPLVQVAIDELPAIIGYLKITFAKKNPTAPALTDDQVIMAYNLAYSSSLNKDEVWLAAHPVV